MGHQQDLDEGESLEVHKYKKDSSQNVYIKKVKLQKFGRHICLVPWKKYQLDFRAYFPKKDCNFCVNAAVKYSLSTNAFKYTEKYIKSLATAICSITSSFYF